MSHCVRAVAASLTLVVALLFVGASASAQLADAATNASCIFQLRFASPSATFSATWPSGRGHTMSELIATLLTNQYPSLNATGVSKVFNDVVFNVTSVAQPAAVDPSVGCAAMKRAMDASPVPPATMSVALQYNVTGSWVGFRPVAVPWYLRHETPQPDDVYTALGAVGAALVLAQIGYGVYHGWLNRGTLEAVGDD